MSIHICPSCKAEIPENSPGKLCPSCALRGAEEISKDSISTPTVEDISEAFPELEVISLIGQGGMGSVYQIRQPELDRVAALKILSPSLGNHPAFAERFAREARVMGKLQHPHIVTIFESGESDGYFYLLMEYVDGVNLREAMKAGRFSPEQALAVVPEICDALQAAHSKGILHRDIKPENILLDREGRVKIVDFGIARLAGDSEQNFTLTMTGHALGSTAYMAPEQYEHPHQVDHRADIYSLGVVIYEMLTGELPLGRFPSPGERAAVNSRIDEIVLKTLEKERDLRQQSVTEVKTDFAEVSSHEKEKEKAKEQSVFEKNVASFFENHQKFFLTSLALWTGGIVAILIGFFLFNKPSPLLIGLGSLPAFFGLIGSGWILWQIRKEQHPAKHRIPLLIFVFWPSVFASMTLPLNLATRPFQANDYNLYNRYTPSTTIELLIYVFFGIIMPLIITRILWRFFGQSKRKLYFRKCFVLLASAIVIISIISAHSYIERAVEIKSIESHYESHYSGSIGITLRHSNINVEEVISNIPARTSVYKNPDYPLLDEKLKSRKFHSPKYWGYVSLEWRSSSFERAEKVFKCFVADLKDNLPQFSQLSPSFKKRNNRKKIERYSIYLMLPFFTPFVLILILTNGKRIEVVFFGLITILTIGSMPPINWPKDQPSDSPWLSPFYYSPSPFNSPVVRSHVIAAEKNDIAMFEKGFSTRLINLINKSEGDSSTLMDEWKSLTYGVRLDRVGNNIRTSLQHDFTGKKFTINSVKLNGEWKIDSLLPIPTTEENPMIAYQKAISAAKDGDRLVVLNYFSDAALAQINTLTEEKSYVEKITSVMDYLSSNKVLSWKVDPKNRNRGWVDFKNTKKGQYKFRCEMIKDREHWQINSEPELIK